MKKRIYRRKPAFKQKLASIAPDIWQMPPFIVARFGGELTQVIAAAVQDYIAQKCLNELKKGFAKETSSNQNLS